jgi:(1->4)-alpha-D-glucan 1-alpha-D-glucosylmutase
MPIATFHEEMATRFKEWPHGMTSTATHDTKRGEDARARLLALAELPGEWASAVSRWKILNAPHLVIDGDMRAPSAPFEYMLYQALIGAWPLGPRDASFLERMQAYALKAAREGKQETSWLNPNEAYEKGLNLFLERILDPSQSAEFLAAIETFTKRTSLMGALNSLSQITLKATIPGMPDFYQGTEFWDFSLVDPDNRRPVNFGERAAVLETLRSPDWNALAQQWDNGHIKLAWTRELLKWRTELADVFTHGDYEPLQVTGPHSDHIIAFARQHQGDAAIIVIARSFAPFTQDGRIWPGAGAFDAQVIAPGFTIDGESYNQDANELSVTGLFQHLPVAIVRAQASPKRARSTRLQ